MYRSNDLHYSFFCRKSRVRISEPEATYPARYSLAFFRPFEDLQKSCHASRDDPTLPRPFHFIIHYDPVIQYYITWYEIVAKQSTNKGNVSSSLFTVHINTLIHTSCDTNNSLKQVYGKCTDKSYGYKNGHSVNERYQFVMRHTRAVTLSRGPGKTKFGFVLI